LILPPVKTRRRAVSRKLRCWRRCGCWRRCWCWRCDINYRCRVCSSRSRRRCWCWCCCWCWRCCWAEAVALVVGGATVEALAAALPLLDVAPAV
jgi:hypothetical protein